MLEIHPDNDSAFFNAYLEKYWQHAVNQLQLSRSRAWNKNDNRFVEQKNSTLVRAYIGFDRLDTVDQTNALNRLHDKLWLYYNFFQPVMRLKQKLVVPQDNGRRHIRRRYDQARTPFDRLCATEVLSADVQRWLDLIRQATSPRELRKEIYDLLAALHGLPGAVEGQPQDVHLTLLAASSLTKGDSRNSVTLSFGRTIPVRKHFHLA